VRRYYFLILLVLVSPIFFIKSSNISLSVNYPGLLVESNNAVVINNTAYSFSNKFNLNADAFGYKKSFFEFDHRDSKKIIVLDELPIKVSIKVNPNLNYVIEIDDIQIEDPKEIFLFKGKYKYSISHKDFLTYQSIIDLSTFVEELQLSIELESVNKNIIMTSKPEGASVKLDNKIIGLTPLSFSLTKNMNQITLTKEGYKNYSSNIAILDNESEKIFFELEKSEDIFSLITTPSSASVFLNNEYRGLTPIKLSNYKMGSLKIQKYGYEDTLIKLDNITTSLNLKLKKATSLVSITTDPSSNIYINNNFIGVTPGNFSLQKVKQDIVFKKPNYRTLTKTIEPLSNNFIINEVLFTEIESIIKESPRKSINSIGLEMVLFDPGFIRIGSSKNESRRDINEVRKSVKLTKHFYMSKNLITEEQFNQFLKTNNNSNKLPINNISWVQAAKFCNWLSKKENLNQFYKFNGNKLISYNSNSNGYRLPTEAEWEYVSKSNRPKNFIYSWGDDRKINKIIGNIADESTKEMLINYISDYTDGFEERSPINSFKPNQNGINDLTGNLSEWVNDFYSVEIISPDTVLLDHLGPLYGSNHVIKGSNFKSSNPLQLGISYRTYGSKKDELVGFRVARWIY